MRGLLRRIGASRLVGIALLLALVVLRLADPLALEALRLRVFDFYQVSKPRVIAARPVTIVDIDEASLRKLGQWPWPRTVIADLVTQLTKMGAIAIGFDVFFPEADRMSPSVAVTGFRGVDDATRQKLAALPDNDALLAQAISQSRVVLARSGRDEPNSPGETDELVNTGVAALGDDPAPYLVRFPGLLHNLAVLENAAAGRGLVTITPERDGISRRVQLAMVADDTISPSLSLEMLRLASGADSIFINTAPGGVREIGVPKLKLQTDGKGQVWTHFAHHDPQKFVSAASVLDGSVKPELIAGKLVLVGTSALGLLDNKTTPVEASMPGVEIHAQIIEAALAGEMLSNPFWAPLAELAASVLIMLGLIGLAPRIGAKTLLLGGGLIAVLLAGGSWYAYAGHKLLLDASFPLLSTFAVFVALIAVNYLNEQNARQKIRAAFGQYLSPDLVEHLAKSPEKLVLGGEERRMTIMFSDVRGFTALSESFKHDPQGLTKLMNRFLTPLTNAILGRKGTIDKYMGDAIMAFWNAPLDDPDHELNGCLAALDMLATIENLNIARKTEAAETGALHIPIKVGIGLNSGTCVVGNMGSDLRFDYSVLGDSVNLASRIEGQSKDYGVANIVGSATAAAVAEKLPLIELDRITVKGKTEPESIFTILGSAAQRHDPAILAVMKSHSDMLSLYRQGRFEEALEASTLVMDEAEACGLELQGLYHVFAVRCLAFIADPPGQEWDGVFVAKSK